jgi:hypothetical protein
MSRGPVLPQVALVEAPNGLVGALPRPYNDDREKLDAAKPACQ